MPLLDALWRRWVCRQISDCGMVLASVGCRRFKYVETHKIVSLEAKVFCDVLHSGRVAILFPACTP
jgi:hypothetical protein